MWHSLVLTLVLLKATTFINRLFSMINETSILGAFSPAGWPEVPWPIHGSVHCLYHQLCLVTGNTLALIGLNQSCDMNTVLTIKSNFLCVSVNCAAMLLTGNGVEVTLDSVPAWFVPSWLPYSILVASLSILLVVFWSVVVLWVLLSLLSLRLNK